jgi:hypothetical protein
MSGLLAGLLAVLAASMVAGFIAFRISGFWKRDDLITSDHAVLVAKPGATLDLTDDTGAPVAKVVLDQITSDYREGITVVFVDYFKYAARNSRE